MGLVVYLIVDPPILKWKIQKILLTDAKIKNNDEEKYVKCSWEKDGK